MASYRLAFGLGGYLSVVPQFKKLVDLHESTCHGYQRQCLSQRWDFGD